MQSESIKELTAALKEVQGKVQHAKKTAKNPYFDSDYADLAAVMDTARELLAANGLAVIQTTRLTEHGSIVLNTMIAHVSGEWKDSDFPVCKAGANPQQMGSALSYARRYQYQTVVGIAPAPGEDDDGNAAVKAPAPKKDNLEHGGVRPAVKDTPAPRRKDGRGGAYPSSGNTMRFGKHKGKRWDEVPVGYWRWWLEQEEAKPERDPRNDEMRNYAEERIIAHEEAKDAEEMNQDVPPEDMPQMSFADDEIPF